MTNRIRSFEGDLMSLGFRQIKNVIIALVVLQTVKADPLPPGASPWITEVQMLTVIFAFNLTVNSTILAAVLKAMRLRIGARFIPVAFALTLGGLMLDSVAARAAFGNALTLYLTAFALIAPFAAVLVKLAYRIDLKKSIAAGIAVGLISNPGIFALLA